MNEATFSHEPDELITDAQSEELQDEVKKSLWLIVGIYVFSQFVAYTGFTVGVDVRSGESTDELLNQLLNFHWFILGGFAFGSFIAVFALSAGLKNAPIKLRQMWSLTNAVNTQAMCISCMAVLGHMYAFPPQHGSKAFVTGLLVITIGVWLLSIASIALFITKANSGEL